MSLAASIAKICTFLIYGHARLLEPIAAIVVLREVGPFLKSQHIYIYNKVVLVVITTVICDHGWLYGPPTGTKALADTYTKHSPLLQPLIFSTAALCVIDSQPTDAHSHNTCNKTGI